MGLEGLRILALGALLVVTALAPATAADTASTPAGAVAPDGDIVWAPVELDGRELFRVAGTRSFPAQQRAAAIRSRLVAVARDPSFSPADLRTADIESHVAIMAGDRQLMAVLDVDGQLERLTRTMLASVYRSRMEAAIEAYRRERTPEALGRDALYALGATAALVALLLLVIRLVRPLEALITRHIGRHFAALEIQSFPVVQVRRLWAMVHFSVRAVRSLALVAIVLAYLHFVLDLFPWTRAAARGVFGLITGPLITMGQALAGQIPNLVFLAVLFVIVRFALRLTRIFFEAVGARQISLSGFDPEWAGPTYSIARIVIVAFALVVAYPYIPGSGSAAFQGISIFLGVLLSLGGSSVIANLISGYLLIYRRVFSVGDRVKIGSVIGDVIEMAPQVTHLRSPKNEEVIVPNSEILTSQVVNYSSFVRERGLILHTSVGIGYEVPWRQVEAMLLLAAERTPGLLKEPPPFILQRALGDFAVEYELNVYCREAGAMFELYTALHREILDIFNEHNVQIMTPAYERDPEQPKVVPKAQWYAAPARPDGPGGAAP